MYSFRELQKVCKLQPGGQDLRIAVLALQIQSGKNALHRPH